MAGVDFFLGVTRFPQPIVDRHKKSLHVVKPPNFPVQWEQFIKAHFADTSIT